MSRDDHLIAGYLLGELPPEEATAFERRMAVDPAFNDAVERMRPVVEGLHAMPSLGWPDADRVEPPPLPPLPGLAAPSRARWRPGRPAVALLGAAALAIGVVIGAVLVDRGGDEANTGASLALTRLGEAGPMARGEARVVDGASDTLQVTVSGLPPSGAGSLYELWLLDGPDRLLSLGSFRVPTSGRVEVDVPLPVPVGEFRFIDVSREPDDGNPAHSGDSVLRGPTRTA
ncbi:MAG TPA: anti-sigma factor [Miltoncostaea sp.]|nr:anti-sigma factor [Miltoncostaea sp.]